MPRKYLRRRPSYEKRTKKKKSTRRRSKSKKMRGGVTVRAQDLQTRLPEDVFREIREMHPLLTPKLNNITLRHAVKEYLGNIKAKLYFVLHDKVLQPAATRSLVLIQVSYFFLMTSKRRNA